MTGILSACAAARRASRSSRGSPFRKKRLKLLDDERLRAVGSRHAEPSVSALPIEVQIVVQGRAAAAHAVDPFAGLAELSGEVEAVAVVELGDLRRRRGELRDELLVARAARRR